MSKSIRQLMIFRITTKIVLFLVSSFSTFAQDMLFTQFSAMPLYLNPAFTGTTPSYRVSTLYRNQWANIPDAYGTNIVALDYNWDYYNSGIGAWLSNDRVNVSNTTSLNITYAYNVPLGRRWVAKLGLQAGVGLRMLNFDQLTFADQLQNGGATTEPIAAQVSQLYPDFGTGLLIYNEHFWFGASAFHLNKPLVTLYSNDDRINVRFSGQIGGKIVFDRKGENYLSPALLYQQQGIFKQMDVGMNLYWQPLVLGVWYRGMPWVSNLAKATSHDAVAGLLGIKYQNLRLTYSYDYTLSTLNFSGGSHEISLTIAPWYDRRSKRGSGHIVCPAF